MVDIINNTSKLLGDDLKKEIKTGSRLRIAASCFSIYAYDALKEELEQINLSSEGTVKEIWQNQDDLYRSAL